MTTSPFDSMLPPQSAGSGVLLFGGTFDPVHQGHIELGFKARDLAEPEGWLVFVPAAISPHKSVRPTPGKHRVEMLRLACQSGGGKSRWWIWQEELNRAERSDAPSYWVDTLESAHKQFGEVSFLLGADQAVAFNRWHKWRRILELAQPVVILRVPFHNTNQLRLAMADAGWSAQDLDVFFETACILDTPLMHVNATEIRQRFAADNGEQIDGLDPAVLRYAELRGLYKK